MIWVLESRLPLSTLSQKLAIKYLILLSLLILAPTILEIAGCKVPEKMTSRSLVKILKANKSGQIEEDRGSVVVARERHAWCRIDGKGYPSRMIRTKKFLYIRNYLLDRWPAGNFKVVTNEGNYGDVDRSPIKSFMITNKEQIEKLFNLSFGKRPFEELYDCTKDPYQINNLADDESYRDIKQQLSSQLTEELKKKEDPRALNTDYDWDV